MSDKVYPAFQVHRADMTPAERVPAPSRLRGRFLLALRVSSNTDVDFVSLHKVVRQVVENSTAHDALEDGIAYSNIWGDGEDVEVSVSLEVLE